MPQDYQLADFFKEYMFRGTISFPDGESPFALEVFAYDPETGLFVASGNDDRGLSGIVGHIYADTDTCSRVEFTQYFNPDKPDLSLFFDAELIKTEDNVLLEGRYTHHYNDQEYSLELKVSLRGEDLTPPGWMDNAMRLVLPKGE